MSDLINRVQEALKESGLSARAASLEAGLSQRFVTDLLDGSKRSMSVESAEKLAPVLNRTPEWLAFGRGPKIPGEQPDAEVINISRRIHDEARRKLWLDMGRQFSDEAES